LRREGDKPVKISDGEKLILLMLSELYEKVGINGEIDPEFIKSAIFRDHLWGIPWKYSGIPFEDRETPAIVKEVVDVLDMWSFIEDRYQDLSDEDKSELAISAAPFGTDPKFRGFDGNNESEYMSVASFLINDLDRFELFKGRSMNSHMPSVDTYQRMLTVFEPMRRTLGFSRRLSVSDLSAILKAQIHPANK
jgi:uncharacterized protein YfbU (UPF0304 family)